MSLGREQSGSLKKYAGELRDLILDKVRHGEDVEATALFHKLRGVKSAAFLLGDFEADRFIGGILGELKRLDGASWAEAE